MRYLIRCDLLGQTALPVYVGIGGTVVHDQDQAHPFTCEEAGAWLWEHRTLRAAFSFTLVPVEDLAPVA
jgi:hypothetical protein